MLGAALSLTLLLGVVEAGAGEAGADSEYGAATYAAPYLSEEARALIRSYVATEKAYPELDDVAAWTEFQSAAGRRGAAALEAYVQAGGDYERQRADIPGVDAYWLSTSKTGKTGPVLVFTHGGAYVGGSGKEIPPAVIEIANTAGMRVLSVDYRLAPQFPFPAAVEDAVSAYRWLLDQGLAPAEIGWFGESAGGGLTLATMHALQHQELPMPGAIAVLSPWTDLTLVSESYFTLEADDPAFNRDGLSFLARAYYQDSDPMNPLVSPVYGEFSGFPPTLIQVGSKEILLSDSLRVARRARAAGVEVSLDVWDGLWHVFQYMNVPESGEAIAELGEFFRRHLNGDSTGVRPDDEEGPADEGLFEVGEFTQIYSAVDENGNPWWINDHCFVRDETGTWHLVGITQKQEPNDFFQLAFDDARIGQMTEEERAQFLAEVVALRAEAEASGTPIFDNLGERQFAHATAGSLLQSPWTTESFALVADQETW
jgi:acetyl esterase/lipase